MKTVSKLQLGRTVLEAPVFFPSVSSVKTALKPIDYIRFLNAMKASNRQLLVSAYDLFYASDSDKQEIKDQLTLARQDGVIVLMDSGNYESYWKESRQTWRQSHFHQALKEFGSSIAFSFDEQMPPENFNEHVRLIFDRYSADQSIAGECEIIPIVHSGPELLPKLCATVAEKTGVSILAVPERRLGDGIFERVETLIKIREALNTTERYIGLHLLGTGNPVSISIYSAYGADTFDGLEWCQTVVDHETGALFHFSQADFFTKQTSWGTSDFPFQMRVLAHNLEFYTDWMDRLRLHIIEGQGKAFCRINFPSIIYAMCAEKLGW